MNAFVYSASRFVLLTVSRLLFLFRTEGAERVPRSGPVLLVGNHASFLDPPMLGFCSPRPVTYLARATLAKRALAARWLRSVGVVLIDREAPSHRALEALVDALRAGAVVAMFPEGTRSKTGAVGEFKRGLLLAVKKTGATVVPVGLEGPFRAWPRTRRLPRPFRACRARVGQPFSADEVLAEGGLARLRACVAELARATLAPDPESSATSITKSITHSEDQRPDGPAAIPNRHPA